MGVVTLNIGEKIKTARKAMGLSQQELGGSEFTKGYISQIENNRTVPSTKVLTVISHKLKLPISYFLEETNCSLEEFNLKLIDGKNLYLQNKFKDALNIFDTIIKFDIKDSAYFTSMAYSGKCLYSLKKYNEGKQLLKKALKDMETLPLYDEQITCLSYIGLCNFSLNEFEGAIFNFNTAIKIIENYKLNMPEKKAKLFLNTGSAYSNIGNFKKAINYFNKNILLCQDNKITDTLLDCHIRIARCYYELNFLKNAKEHVLKASAINKSLDSTIEKTEIYSMLGLILAKENVLDKAIKLIFKSMEICRNINYEFGYNLNIVYYTFILIISDNITEAERFSLNHVKKLERSQDTTAVCLLYGYMGIIYEKIKDLNKAKLYFKLAIDSCISKNFYVDVYRFSKQLADMLITLEPLEAKFYYNISLEYIKKTNI